MFAILASLVLILSEALRESSLNKRVESVTITHFVLFFIGGLILAFLEKKIKSK